MEMATSASDHPSFWPMVRHLDSTGEWRRLLDISDQYGPVLEPVHTAGEAWHSTTSTTSTTSHFSPATQLLRQLFQQLGSFSTDELAELLMSVGLRTAAHHLLTVPPRDQQLQLPPHQLSVRQLTETNTCNCADGKCPNSHQLHVTLGARLVLRCCSSCSCSASDTLLTSTANSDDANWTQCQRLQQQQLQQQQHWLHYQWSRDGVQLVGENTACLVVDSFGADNAGVYGCVVTVAGSGGGGVVTAADGGGGVITAAAGGGGGEVLMLTDCTRVSAGTIHVLPRDCAPVLRRCLINEQECAVATASSSSSATTAAAAAAAASTTTAAEGLQQTEVSCGEPAQDWATETAAAAAAAAVAAGGGAVQLLVSDATGSAVLHCQWSGWPLPRLCWLRDGRPINGKTTDTLHLSRLGSHLRCGRFVCRATNCHGEAVSPVFSVQTPSAPVITRQPAAPHCHLVAGRSYTFICHALCRTPVHAIWRVTVADRARAVSPSDCSTTVLSCPAPAIPAVPANIPATNFSNVTHSDSSSNSNNTAGNNSNNNKASTTDSSSSNNNNNNNNANTTSTCSSSSSCLTATQLVAAQLQLPVLAEDARAEHRVTCEFVDPGDVTLRCMSDPAVFSATYSASSKLCLIIGNSRYHHLEPLHKVTEDVETFRCRVQQLGFGVLVAMNVDLRLTWRMVRYFGRVARRGAYLLVFVAGHGFTHQRVDYLVPVDAHRRSPGTMPPIDQCVSLELVENLLQRAAPALIVTCADMCRNAHLQGADPPPAGPPPPSRTASATRNVLRLYSAQIGEEAFDDGRFMCHLLNCIDQDVSIQQLGLHALNLQGCQAPIVEIALAEKRSLLDSCDCRTVLDNCVERRHHAILTSGVALNITERWTNCVCDELGAVLRVTLSLHAAGGGGNCGAGAQKLSQWRVQMAVMFLVQSNIQVPLQFESVCDSGVTSWWHCPLAAPLTPPPPSAPLRLHLLLVLTTGAEGGSGAHRRHGYRTPPLSLPLSSMGLLSSSVTST